MLQWVRSVLYTVLLFLGTGFFGVIVLLSALLPLSIEQRYVIPRAWGLSLTWLAKVVCGLGYVIEGQENLPSRPFISLWKHSSVWETLAQMFVVPPASWSALASRASSMAPDSPAGPAPTNSTSISIASAPGASSRISFSSGRAR